MSSLPNNSGVHSVTREFLAFVLGDETYALDIMSVKEIRGYEPVTKIANAPNYIKGVINLRGDIVPIVDLRIKFGVGEPSYNEWTIVIMLNIKDRILGIVVDGVSDVMNFEEEDIKPAPEFGAAFDSRYLDGLAAVDDLMVIVVDIEALVSSEELGLFDTLDTV
ncbi:Chemotaxis protein CheW [Marinomonas spartinae]|uniref:Chemotaxis protein CheW n=1 Tax=Marinomonas spartinae TaxID=1792290 RepID=A0A1A8TR40_9GAMM|nr:chemotaxis protein CheW [Marinomonas spartinae]SBS35349.1 Chemotaxis protein CheW [Marinomonas spartinae]SBS39399.1 Chemotaxis protein CheW [Marinomonas spartinae]